MLSRVLWAGAFLPVPGEPCSAFGAAPPGGGAAPNFVNRMFWSLGNMGPVPPHAETVMAAPVSALDSPASAGLS
jgi:hypothetical protein